MTLITVTNTGGARHIMARVERAIAEVPGLTTELVSEVGTLTVDALHNAAPVGTGRTGGEHLANSFSQQLQEYQTSIITNQAQKLTFVRYGTRTPIRPLVKKFLYSEELPHPMASVRGQAANDFVTPVLDKVTDFVIEELPPFIAKLLAILRGA